MITFVIPSTKWRTYLDQFIGPGDLIENLGKSLILANLLQADGIHVRENILGAVVFQ